MNPQPNQNASALDLVAYAIRAGYAVEMYDLHVVVDDVRERLVLSSAARPVEMDSPRRAKHAPATDAE